MKTTDTESGWNVVIADDGVATEREPSGSADLTLTGTAASLYLWLWNRGRADDLEIHGDTSLLTAWADHVQVRWS